MLTHKIMNKLKFTALAVLLLSLFACKSQYEILLSSNDVDAKYKAAMELFNDKKYQKAAQLFESMAVLTSGTARDDTVQYYWGLSNYRNKDYFTAESNFDRFVQNFPRSPFAADAAFYRLDCLYRATYRWELDQLPTRTCMAHITEYMRENADDDVHIEVCRKMLADLQDRLDRKDFEAGRQYYHMEQYPSARIKLLNVLKTNANNNYREDVLYYTAMSSYEYPESHYRKELDGIYRQVQKILGKDGVAEDEKPNEK